jgi:integrase/recombinase XerC
MQWKKAVSEFLNYIESQRGYSINTADSYGRDLRQFAEVLKIAEDGDVVSVFTKGNIRKFIYFLKDDGQKAKSIARKRSTLLSFGKYMIKVGELFSNPVRLVSVPKLEKTIPVIITEPQMRELAEDYEEEQQKPQEAQNPTTVIRDELIVELLYGSGIRVSELHNLRRREINWSNGTMRVMGKGRKERIVPLTDVAIKLLKEFLGENIRKDGFVFPRTAKSGRKESKNYDDLKGERATLHKDDISLLTVRRIRQIVNKELSKVSEAKKKSPHILRHSFASHLLDNGADIRVVKEMLGHSSLASTQVYTHVGIEKMLKSYKQAHPRSGE